MSEICENCQGAGIRGQTPDGLPLLCRFCNGEGLVPMEPREPAISLSKGEIKAEFEARASRQKREERAFLERLSNLALIEECARRGLVVDDAAAFSPGEAE